MPLADFVRYLNSQLPYPPSDLRSGTPFVSEDGHVHVVYSGLRLESAFFPIVATNDGRLRGHGARLLASDESRLLESKFVYTLPGDDNEFIALDRLVRTLHTLNYLTYRERRPLLLLKVHPRHVASVAADHGLVFEEILRSCGLMPEQITLEFDVVNGRDAAHLQRAIASYKSRGYGIAIGGFGQDEVDLKLLRIVRPAIVKLDLLSSTYHPKRLIDQLHELGAQVMIEGPDGSVLNSSQKSSFDLLQVQARQLRQAPSVFSSQPVLASKAA